MKEKKIMDSPKKEMILEHTFPSGVHIDEYFDPSDEYIKEIYEIDSIDKTNNLINKWKYLFPQLLEVNMGKFVFNEFLNFRGNPKYQELHFKDDGAQNYFYILLPYELIRYSMISSHFGAPISIVMLQAYNAEIIEEKDGYWFFKEREISVNGKIPAEKTDTESQPSPE